MPHVGADLDHPPALFRGRQHPVRLGDVHRERLLAQDVRPGLQRRDRDLAVRLGHGGDADEVEVPRLEQLAEIPVAVRAPGKRCPAAASASSLMSHSAATSTVSGMRP